MTSAQDFLTEEREILELKLHDIREEAVKIEERIKYCDELLERIEEKWSEVAKERSDTERLGLTTSDILHLILQHRGPLTVRELQTRLKELCEMKTTNDLYVILNRQKGKRFGRNQDGKWSIKVKDDPAQREVALDERFGIDEFNEIVRPRVLEEEIPRNETRPQVSARAIVADIKSGMTAADLKNKYRLTDGQMQRVFTKLIDNGLLKD